MLVILILLPRLSCPSKITDSQQIRTRSQAGTTQGRHCGPHPHDRASLGNPLGRLIPRETRIYLGIKNPATEAIADRVGDAFKAT